ncbi:MAG TPA: acyltransferase [Chitinophagaceae bacterium]|jgi:peptidoglycan/LPS O-acetylase OafA/YrhL|nr:acyltransferase [Chitinophagaceae bacterium]HMU58723.1 acyltransferase [Chitinophagaceae bacterium]
MRNERIFGLDVLRAAAIILVLFSHTSFLLPVCPEDREIMFLLSGYLGVELFFVLSGFLIGGILFEMFSEENSMLTAKVFWIRRWFRTFPNYFLALLINLLIVLLSGVKDISAINYLLYFVFSQNLVVPNLPFFIESWSLSIEEWTYIVIPFLFNPFKKRKKGLNRKSVAIRILVVILISGLLKYLVYQIDKRSDWDSEIRRIVIFRIDSICIGVFASWLKIEYSFFWKKYKTPSFLFGFMILIINLFVLKSFIADGEKFRMYLHTVFLIVTSVGVALLLPLLSFWEKTSSKLLFGIFTYVSKVSYSAYLFHVIVINYSLVILNDMPVFLNIWYIKYTVCWILTLSISGVIYIFFELPAMKLRDRFG